MKFEIQIPKITVDAQWIGKLDLPRFLQQEALNTRTQILANLNAGKQADGAGMRPYSPGYARLKASATGSSTVNLNVTGELHRSMVTRNIKDGVEMVFQGSHAPSRPLTGGKTESPKAEKKNAGNLRAASGAKKIKGARSARTIAPKAGKTSGGASSGGGGGSSMSNAALAESLYARGFTGWVSFSPQRLKEIEVSLGKEVDKILKSVIVVK